jgi:hypothetical protein
MAQLCLAAAMSQLSVATAVAVDLGAAEDLELAYPPVEQQDKNEQEQWIEE